MTPKEVLEFAEKNQARIVDLRFTDLPGLWHHVSFPIHQLKEKSFEDGFGIDGSSIRGWAAIHESDMLLVPDPKTAFLDPFRDTPTLCMVGDVIDPLAGSYYIESLTDRVEEEANAYLRRIEDIGGALEGIEQGFQQREIQESAYRLQKQRGNNLRQAVQDRVPIHAQAVILASLAVDRGLWPRFS